MQFVCLGYDDASSWNAMSEAEQNAVIEKCFRYVSELLKRGHWVEGGAALQSARSAKTLRFRSGKVIVSDGPFAETKEQLAGAGVLEAKDIDHAVELMSRHPGVREGSLFEIRPVDEQLRKRSLEAEAKHRLEPPVASSPNPHTKDFACMGYITESTWDGKSPCEIEDVLRQCIEFDLARRRDGQWQSGIALQSASTAKTVRAGRGKLIVTDGPFAETKEQLGGIVVLRLKDMQHAVDLLSTHPALRFGVTIEIRPIDEEIVARWEARLG